MTTIAFRSLLEMTRHAHNTTDALRNFCPFPTDLKPAEWVKHIRPAAALCAAESGWWSDPVHPLTSAFLKAGPEAQWREPYLPEDIGQDFCDRFGCYCLIGSGGPWHSQTMRAFVVYMPPNLWYPWHQHPAEELYFVLAGEGEFLRDGHTPKVLRAGESCFHESGQSHALCTHDKPVLAYVLWRNNFDVPPVLTTDVKQVATLVS